MTVELVSFAQGVERSTHQLATLRLTFPVRAQRGWLPKWLMKRRLERALEPIVQEQFEDSGVVPIVRQLEYGSVTALVAIIAPLVVAEFVKSFPKFKEGVVSIVETVKANEMRIQHEVERVNGSLPKLTMNAVTTLLKILKGVPIASGIAIDWLGTYLVAVAISLIWPRPQNGAGYTYDVLVLQAVGGVIATAIGGFGAGLLAKRHGLAYGAIVGLVSVVVSSVILSFTQEAATIPNGIKVAELAAFLPAGILGGLLASLAYDP
jgi:hypothetical protein